MTVPCACWFLWWAHYIEDFKRHLHVRFGVAFQRVGFERGIYWTAKLDRVCRALKTSILNTASDPYLLYILNNKSMWKRNLLHSSAKDTKGLLSRASHVQRKRHHHQSVECATFPLPNAFDKSICTDSKHSYMPSFCSLQRVMGIKWKSPGAFPQYAANHKLTPVWPLRLRHWWGGTSWVSVEGWNFKSLRRKIWVVMLIWPPFAFA